MVLSPRYHILHFRWTCSSPFETYLNIYMNLLLVYGVCSWIRCGHDRILRPNVGNFNPKAPRRIMTQLNLTDVFTFTLQEIEKIVAARALFLISMCLDSYYFCTSHCQYYQFDLKFPCSLYDTLRQCPS